MDDDSGEEIIIPFTGQVIVTGICALLARSDEHDFRQHYLGVPTDLELSDLTKHGLYDNCIYANMAGMVWQVSFACSNAC